MGRNIRIRSLTILLLACPSSLRAASDGEQRQPSSPTTLTVTALDRNHHPVTDLKCDEFQIFDEGRSKSVSDCSLIGPQRSTVVIVWDLLNIVKGHRGYSNDLIVRSIRSLPDTSSVYLYLLSNAGKLYPIRALDGTEASRLDWPRQIQASLDAAFDELVRFRPIDFQNEGIRAGTTFERLAELNEQMKSLPGPKSILWLTAGVPNLMLTTTGCRNVLFPGEPDYLAAECVATCDKYGSGTTCIDYAPFLKRFSQDLQSSGTSLYVVEETPYSEVRRADKGSPHDTLEQLSLLSNARLFPRGEIDAALSGALLDSLSRFRVSFAGAADGKPHRLRFATTRANVSIEGPARYFAARP